MRSASSSVLAPGRSHVYAQFAAERKSKCRGRDVEVGAQLAALDALAEEIAHPLLVASALGDELLAALALEIAPFAHEDGRDVELRRRRRRGARAARGGCARTRAASAGTPSRPAWKASAPSRATSQSRSSFESMWRVQRALLHAERLGEVGERRAVVAPLGEEAGGDPGQLLTPRGHLDS